MVDIRLHDEAVKGLPISINKLFDTKAVDKISIYSYLAREKLMDFTLKNNEWNSDLMPGSVIEAEQNKLL